MCSELGICIQYSLRADILSTIFQFAQVNAHFTYVFCSKRWDQPIFTIESRENIFVSINIKDCSKRQSKRWVPEG